MASILKIGDGGRAQIRRMGHAGMTETFSTQAQASQWARKVEAEMDAKRFKDVRGLANLTLKALIDRYREEIGAEHPFGKNKTTVLSTWARDHGECRGPALRRQQDLGMQRWYLANGSSSPCC